eukprot:3339019-Prymnesium_polylepis.1
MNERRFGKEVDINGGLEMTLVGYKHALRELQEAQPGEFVNFKPEEPMRMVEWAVRCEATGHSIPAAVAVAEQIGFPLQQVAAEHAKRAAWIVGQGCNGVAWAVPCALLRAIARMKLLERVSQPLPET